jgi:ribosomal protein S18 acetylase RimI-like enzyme
VAEEAGTVQGFATLITYDPNEPNYNGSELEQQAITGLFMANEAAGDALIQACEVQATTIELGAFPATHGNTPLHTYNAGWDGLSDRVPNVAHLLTKHGYTPYFRELNLVAPLPLDPRATRTHPSEIVVTAKDAPADSLGVPAVRVMDGENQAGICSYSTLALLSSVPAASRAGYIWELYVEEAYRRRGIARALMVTAMNQLVALGCTACWLTTTANNWNAQSLYYSLDFEVVDSSVSFRKRIRS